MFNLYEIAPLVLLVLSELLPFIKHTQANGVLQFIMMILKSYAESQGANTTTTNIYTSTVPVPHTECVPTSTTTTTTHS
jgi:hypothetical protein